MVFYVGVYHSSDFRKKNTGIDIGRPKTLIERINLNDDKVDRLSHPSRKNIIHILSLDSILANDVYERIHNDKRMKFYQLIKPRKTEIRQAVEEIENMARETVLSRLLIIDVRRATLPKLQRAYNKVVGYNRRDLNKICYTILIGDGPIDLFQDGKTMDVFIPHLATHRVDFHPALLNSSFRIKSPKGSNRFLRKKI
jgi:hypothetical protein